MPIYEFRCSECDTVFEEKRGAEMSGAPAPACPNGHDSTRGILSVFATAGRGAGSDAGRAGTLGRSGGGMGGGCGPGCACAANA